MPPFVPSRLTLARERRGLTKAELARRAALTSRSVAAYESGETVPTDETLERLSRELRFPIPFFSRPPLDVPPPEAASFRALARMTAAQRDEALAAGAFAQELSSWIDQRFALPPLDLPDLRAQYPEAAADALRARWGLGVRPLGNTVHLLEAHGVRVFSLVQECKEVDAFSVWSAGGAPFVFLNTMKTPEHGRYDAAHELGHLVLHRHGTLRSRHIEHEANSFASAFLMPRAHVLANAPRFPTLDRLLELKRTWNVSVAALIRRLHDVGLLTEWHYRSLYIQLSDRYGRESEPNPMPNRETSQLLAKVFNGLREEGLTKVDVARDLAIPIADLETLVFGLTLVRL